MPPGLLAQQGRRSLRPCKVPCQQNSLYLQGLKFADEHLVVGIAGYKHNVVELPERREFVCLQREPYVNPLLYHLSLAVALKLPQMLVVEYDIVLDERVLEFALVVEEMLVIRSLTRKRPLK